MSGRKAFFILRKFDCPGDRARGVIEHDGGTHVCYWHALASTVPPPGKYQMLMHDAHFSLRDHPADLRPVGHGSGIELGRIMHADHVSMHGDLMIGYLQGMHRTRDAEGIASWIEVR